MDKEEFQGYFIKHFTKTWPSLIVMENLPCSDEIQEWIDENCDDESICLPVTDVGYLYCFKTDADAVAFKLRWS